MKTEFVTDSQQFEIKTVGSVGSYSIFCDGKLLNQDAFMTPNGEAVSWIRVVANESTQRKMRHFEIYSVNTAIGAIVFQTTDTVINDIPNERPLIYQMGDSYTYGTGAAYPNRDYGTSPAVNDFYAFSRSLGFDGIAEGIGGSGWNSTGGQYPQSRVQTRLNMLNREPAVISFALGYNDAAAINTGDNRFKLQESFRLAVLEARKKYPTTPIILISAATPAGLTSNISLVNVLLEPVAAELGVEVIKISNYVTADNKSIYTGSDNVHPNGAGHQFRGLAMASECIKAAKKGLSLTPPVYPIGYNYVARVTYNFGVGITSGMELAFNDYDLMNKVSQTLRQSQKATKVEFLSVSKA
ncbi:MAG: SGNH/GDSL hydrolase family protein [Fibrobacter sp.]|nr:SGNH/GDSL hydrolase family protein [Fibrobacter sp.]